MLRREMVCVDSLPPPLPLSCSLSRFVYWVGVEVGCWVDGGQGGGLVEVDFDHWQKVAMVRFLWRSTERFALQL